MTRQNRIRINHSSYFAVAHVNSRWKLFFDNRMYVSLFVSIIIVCYAIPVTSKKHTSPPIVSNGGNKTPNTLLLQEIITNNDRIPNLFGTTTNDNNNNNNNNANRWKRYAACLAATEGIRRIRDHDIMKIRFGGKIGTSQQHRRRLIEQIESKYQQSSNQIIKALGMTPSEFQLLGQQIQTNDELANKVIEQAYLYRVAATVRLDQPITDSITKRTVQKPKHKQQQQQRPTITSFVENNLKVQKFQQFVTSLVEVESLRKYQMEQLQRSLNNNNLSQSNNVKKELVDLLSDPSLVPYLNPKVRAVMKAFPYQVEDIINSKYNFTIEEYNALLNKAKTNPFFRWRIQRKINTMFQS